MKPDLQVRQCKCFLTMTKNQTTVQKAHCDCYYATITTVDQVQNLTIIIIPTITSAFEMHLSDWAFEKKNMIEGRIPNANALLYSKARSIAF